MHYITPQDCVRILKVKSINDIRIPMLRSIAEQERQFAKNYYNDDSDRSDKTREDNIVDGKLGELIVMISLAKSGYEIIQGVLFSDNNSKALKNGDGGIDLKSEYQDNRYEIQVKYCNSSWLNFETERQESAVRKNLNDNVKVLICHHCIENKHKKYVLRKLDKEFFKLNLKPSNYNNCKSYINCYDIQKFKGFL